MDEQNKSMNERWAPPTDRGERGYATDPGYASGTEYSTRPDVGTTSEEAGDESADARATEIRQEIHQTRADMRETIDAIQDRLRPANVASRAVHSVKEATVDRVKDFAGNITGYGARDERNDDWRYRSLGYDGTSRGTGLLDRIRDNPVATAMAAGSIAWLLLGDRRRDRRPDYSREDQGERYGWDQSGTRSTGTRLMSDASQQLTQVTHNVQRRTRNFAWNSPLMAGAMAAGVGLAIGLTIPETERENEILGDARDSLVDRGKAAVRTAAERVQTAAGDVQRVAGDALKGMTPGESAGGSQTTSTRQAGLNTEQSAISAGSSPVAGETGTEQPVPGTQAGSGGTGATPTTRTARTRR
jgi:ElaB/YqjD/DUF883 family membrane-anchored ribosome-binding protein